MYKFLSNPKHLLTYQIYTIFTNLRNHVEEEDDPVLDAGEREKAHAWLVALSRAAARFGTNDVTWLYIYTHWVMFSLPCVCELCLQVDKPTLRVLGNISDVWHFWFGVQALGSFISRLIKTKVRLGQKLSGSERREMEMGHSLCFGAIGIETHGKWDKNIQNDSWAENPPPHPPGKVSMRTTLW